ncbi:MAG: phage tail protein [Bacteroidetes bacterium]|nr:MAG: phage tail protein [Bacteroidota bacterium]
MEGTMAEIRLFAGNFSPKSWGYCNGQLLSIAQNTALFSLLGTTYGGDGRVTFALPDFRGRHPLSSGQGPGLPNYPLGLATGTQSTSLTLGNLPPHSHSVTGTPSVTIKMPCNISDGSGTEPEGQYPATPAGGATMYSPAADSTLATINLNPVSNLIASVAGASMPIPLGSPYLGINYIICMYGIYPSRD